MSIEPFLFSIPLRAKAVAHDWDRVCHLLSSTLDSILNQSDQNFSVVLACHDVPDLALLKDPRIAVIRTETPTPSNLSEQMTDKHRKKRLGLAHLRQLGGGWFMPVDADDLVSNQLVERVRLLRPRFGLIIDQGWEFDCAKKGMRPAPRFNRLCGSSGIFRFAIHDLPVQAYQTAETIADAFRDHTCWRKTAVALGRPLDLLNFRAAVYTTNNQENHSVLVGDIGWKRRLVRLVTPLLAPTPAQVTEFSLGRLLAAGPSSGVSYGSDRKTLDPSE